MALIYDGNIRAGVPINKRIRMLFFSPILTRVLPPVKLKDGSAAKIQAILKFCLKEENCLLIIVTMDGEKMPKQSRLPQKRRHSGRLVFQENDRENKAMQYGKGTILVVGQAKPSREDAIYSLHGEFYISLVLEKESGKILNVECNTILHVTSDFVAEMFIGKSLRTDLELLEGEIRSRYFAMTQKPLIACMKDAYNRYMMVLEKERRL